MSSAIRPTAVRFAELSEAERAPQPRRGAAAAGPAAVAGQAGLPHLAWGAEVGCEVAPHVTYRPLGPRRVVLLNALVPPAEPAVLAIGPVSWQAACAAIRQAASEGRLASHIHEATAAAIRQACGVEVPTNRALYVPQRGDYMLVFRVRGGSDLQVGPEDLEIFGVEI